MQLQTNSLGSYTVPLLAGDAGVAQTIDVIRELVDQALSDAVVNRTALEIVRAVPAYDDYSEASAIWAWVFANIRFTKDPVGKETLRTARDLLTVRAGDCDEINGILLPSLLGSVGYPTRLVTVASHPAAPDTFSHVYCEVLINGEWIPCDAARRDAQFGVAPGVVFRAERWPITDPELVDVSGLGNAWSIVESISRNVADVARDQSYNPLDPWSSFRTPYSPYSSPAGYPTSYGAGAGMFDRWTITDWALLAGGVFLAAKVLGK